MKRIDVERKEVTEKTREHQWEVRKIVLKFTDLIDIKTQMMVRNGDKR